jgi:Xaa-Pro dipeptidase
MELGFCWSSLPVHDFLELQARLPHATFVDASDCVGRAMSVKSPAEIECIRRAGRITVKGMDAAIDALREGDGITDNDVAAAALDAMTRAGGEYSAYPIIVTTGTRSGVPHSTYHRAPICAGDPVFLEFAGVVNRYHAPMMRVAVIGEPDPKLRALADAAIASVEAMLAEIRPSRRIVEVAAAGQARLASIDPAVVWHGYFGYSVGLGFPPEWSDCPSLLIRLDAPRDATLKPGMVFHLSTSLREIGVRGATCCETVQVTESGCEIFTEGVSRGLIVVA